MEFISALRGRKGTIYISVIAQIMKFRVLWQLLDAVNYRTYAKISYMCKVCWVKTYCNVQFK